MNQVSTLDPRLKPAEPEEIATALRLLCSSMKPPEGSDIAMMLDGYGVALAGYPVWAIANAARKFIRGEIPGQSLDFCPRPPALSTAVRKELDWIYREIEHAQRSARIAQENAEFRSDITRTAADKERAAARYRQFCEDYQASRRKAEEQERIVLDPALVAQVDDAPTTWERLRWMESGGRNGKL